MEEPDPLLARIEHIPQAEDASNRFFGSSIDAGQPGRPGYVDDHVRAQRSFEGSEVATPEGLGKLEPRHFRMFTARPATITTVVMEASASSSMSALARDVSGIVSVGLKAVAFVNDRYR